MHSTLNKHARGALLGLAVGDASGAPSEFSRPPAAPFTPLLTTSHRLMTGGGPFDLAPGQTTDDTAMAVALSESLSACGAYSAKDAAARYLAWSRLTFDIGNQTAAALNRVDLGDEPERAGRHVWEQRGRDAAGNGSLMRAAPIGVFFAGSPDLIRAASLADSAITHFDPRCQIACVAFNAAIGLACSADRPTPAALLDVAGAEIDVAAELLREKIGSAEVDAARNALHDDLRLAREQDPKLYGPELHLHDHQGYVRVAFRMAFWHALHAPNFEAAITDVVMRGGDTDTVATITGALLGALHGEHGIPAEWARTVLRARASPRTREVATRYHPRRFLL